MWDNFAKQCAQLLTKSCLSIYFVVDYKAFEVVMDCFKYICPNRISTLSCVLCGHSFHQIISNHSDNNIMFVSYQFLFNQLCFIYHLQLTVWRSLPWYSFYSSILPFWIRHNYYNWTFLYVVQTLNNRI